jgi:hypothetical protein
MMNTALVPNHIAEAVVSPRAYAERDALFSRAYAGLGSTTRSGSLRPMDTIRSGP